MSADSPQLEEGFTPIANSIMEALARTQLSGYEWRVLFFLLRKTYGWNKKSDRISLSQFVDGTGINQRRVIEAINSLIAKNIIHKTSAEKRTSKGREYEFNKHYGSWVLVRKSAVRKSAYAEKRLEVVRKSADTISIEETKDKRTTKSDSKPKRHKFKIPHVVFDPMTLQLSGIDDEARRAFAAACPKANLDDCLERLKAWIIKKGAAYENYWRTLCTIGSGDQMKYQTDGKQRIQRGLTDVHAWDDVKGW
jgi:phage replication O-like protein O